MLAFIEAFAASISVLGVNIALQGNIYGLGVLIGSFFTTLVIAMLSIREYKRISVAYRQLLGLSGGWSATFVMSYMVGAASMGDILLLASLYAMSMLTFSAGITLWLIWKSSLV